VVFDRRESDLDAARGIGLGMVLVVILWALILWAVL
jgi:hypothetical protein